MCAWAPTIPPSSGEKNDLPFLQEDQEGHHFPKSPKHLEGEVSLYMVWKVKILQTLCHNYFIVEY